MTEKFTFNPDSISDAEVSSRIPDDLNKKVGKIELSILEKTNNDLLQLSNSPAKVLENAEIPEVAKLFNDYNNKDYFNEQCLVNILPDLKLS